LNRGANVIENWEKPQRKLNANLLSCNKIGFMKTLAVTVANKKQELLFTTLANELGIEITEAQFKPLTTKDVALGIGRKFTNAELHEYIGRKATGKPTDASDVKKSLKQRLHIKS
jgi:hypothetical protein